MHYTISHRRWLLTSSAMVLSFALDAHAQDSKESPDETAPAAIVNVTGIKRAYLKAIESKLDRTGIADVVSANEVQGLPDNTIVETLRRVPGLSVLPTLDNEHPRDEAATPVLRGLGAAYNNVTIDGSPLASPGTPNGNLGSIGRGVRLDLLPSSMISELVVSKTFSADQEPNAIGGAVDLKTRSAFERGGKPFFTFEGSGGGASDSGEPRDQERIGKRLITTGSFTFGPQREYGAVVSANYQKLETSTNTHMTTDTVFENFYDAAGNRVSGNNLGNGYAVPQQDKYWYVQDDRSRLGLTVKLEAKPNEQVYGFLTAGYYRFRDLMQRNENLIDPRNTATVYHQTPTSGHYPGGDVEVGFSQQDMTSATRLLQSGVDWKLSDDETLALRANVSRATYREPILMIKFATNTSYSAPGSGGATPVATPEYGFDYDTSGLNHSFNVSPAAYNDLSNYKLLYYRDNYVRSATDTIGNVRADYRRRLDRPGLGFAAGVSYTLDRPSYDIFRNDLEPNTSQPALTLAGLTGPSAPLMYNHGGLGLITIDPQAAMAQIAALRAAGGLNTTNQTAFSNQDNFEHVEKTAGAYVQGSFNTDRWRTLLGLREDHTKQRTNGRALVAGNWTGLPTGSSYHFLLPSIQATYQATPALDVRAAASQTIGRPTYDSYAARSSINFTNASDAGNPNAQGVSVTIGNPDIKPRLSTNTDLAVDYRLPKAANGLLSLAVFNKDIRDEIFNQSSLGYTYQGVTYANAVVSRPANASDASVKGVEASAVVNSLGWAHPVLADVGFSANWSVLDGSMAVRKADGGSRDLDRLVGQPNQTRNLTVFYARKGLELRAAYNYQGKALRSIVPDIPWQDLYWAPRSQVDLQASYRFTPTLTLFGQVQNLHRSRMTSLTGPGQNLLKDTYSVPLVAWIGLRYTPNF
ncbi:TonB-dependent receptor [Massilia sp. TN1-12]|uniref:TonB-dependent receptor n=1 Tax=Massilia paldalensis TaxID=3377675 RepID=UPI0038515D1F